MNLLNKHGPMSMSQLSGIRKSAKVSTFEIIKGRKDRKKLGLFEMGHVSIHEKIKLGHSKKHIMLWTITDKGRKYSENFNPRILAF